MVLVYRPHVSRWQRAWRVLKAKPKYWMENYTEVFFASVLTIPVCLCFGIHKFYKYGWINNYETGGWTLPPYYREYYEVRRPDDPRVLEWRVPEEYPPEFLTNRQGDVAAYAWHDYAWDKK